VKKVLIVTYYWPPAGGGGVQRWLKFVKYLSEAGWEPIVYTPKNAEYPIEDTSLQPEVPSSVKIIGTNIFEPRKLFKKLFKKENVEVKGVRDQLDNLFYIPPNQRKWHQNLAIWIRANMFIPDARKTWVKPSFKFLSNYIQDHQIETIITTGPPHSLHLIGLALKKVFPGLFWVSDFRDPWMEIEYFDLLPLTNRSLQKHHSLEQSVICGADHVITVSPSWAKMLKGKGAKAVSVITNGYDPIDFDAQLKLLPQKFRICHVGTLAYDRNPDILWSALSDLISQNVIKLSDLEIAFVGKTEPQIFNQLSTSHLNKCVLDYGYVTHRESINIMKQSQLLLLLINKGQRKNAKGRIPGKIFEYMASKKKVLMIGPLDTDAGNLVDTIGGIVINKDVEKLKRSIVNLYDNYLKGKEENLDSQLEIFQRKNLTQQLIDLLIRK
jgi:glycosyltransferase involved in cell wall biosynthesis